MKRLKLNYWDGYEVKQINLHEIVSVYMVPTPRHPEKPKVDEYDVNAETTYSQTIWIRQDVMLTCLEYMKGFDKVGFIPMCDRHLWKNPEHINPIDEGEDLEGGHIYPLFTTEDLEGLSDE